MSFITRIIQCCLHTQVRVVYKSLIFKSKYRKSLFSYAGSFLIVSGILLIIVAIKNSDPIRRESFQSGNEQC